MMCGSGEFLITSRFPLRRIPRASDRKGDQPTVEPVKERRGNQLFSGDGAEPLPQRFQRPFHGRANAQEKVPEEEGEIDLLHPFDPIGLPGRFAEELDRKAMRQGRDSFGQANFWGRFLGIWSWWLSWRRFPSEIMGFPGCTREFLVRGGRRNP